MNKVKIKDFARVVSGATPSTSKPDYYDGDIIWVTPKDLADQNNKYFYKGERTITETGYKSCSTEMIPPKSLLLSSRAPIGLLAITKVNCCTNQGFKSIVVDENVCDIEFLYYYFKYHIKEIEALGTGTTFKEVSKDSIEKYELELPDIEEQRRVVRILKLIDEKIILNNEINDNLSHEISDVFNYWFTQFDFPDSGGKPYKSSGGKMIWNEKIKREIPENWCMGTFNDICCYENGDRSSNYPSVSDFKSSGIPFINGGAIEDNTINIDSLQYITEEKYQSLRAGKAERDDILLTLRGSLEKCVYSPFDKAAIASALVIIRAKNDIPTTFVYHSLISDYFRQLCRNYNNGSVQANLSVDVISAFPCIIPDSGTLQKFAEYAYKTDRYILQIHKENEYLRNIRRWLLPLLINGQATISD